MERTIEEILISACGLEFASDAKEYCHGNVYWEHALEAMEAYANQQVEFAVDKALELAAEEADFSDNDKGIRPSGFEVRQSILSLKPQILEELNLNNN